MYFQRFRVSTILMKKKIQGNAFASPYFRCFQNRFRVSASTIYISTVLMKKKKKIKGNVFMFLREEIFPMKYFYLDCYRCSRVWQYRISESDLVFCYLFILFLNCCYIIVCTHEDGFDDHLLKSVYQDFLVQRIQTIQ